MSSDPYDVYSYESADEFAAEMQHDREFDDYDDAYSYWEEKQCSRKNSINASRKSSTVSSAKGSEPDIVNWFFEEEDHDSSPCSSNNYTYSRTKTSSSESVFWCFMKVLLLVFLRFLFSPLGLVLIFILC